jgi:hypothetical protein
LAGRAGKARSESLERQTGAKMMNTLLSIVFVVGVGVAALLLFVR